MRNLKKILALALALVMTLSLMTVANAFNDDSHIDAKYDEAVTVLSNLKVFKGVNDGSNFAPKQTITRAEVAAIIYRIVTGDVNDTQAGIYADYAKFADVADTHWAAGYIGYCSNAELIVGDGTNFYPDQTVNGYQALAMILRAMGYDANDEFKGEGWEIRVASTAQQRNLLVNINAGTLGTGASREMVAEILFQAITKNTVVYTPALGYYTADLIDGIATESLGYKTFGLTKVVGEVTAVGYQAGTTTLTEVVEDYAGWLNQRLISDNALGDSTVIAETDADWTKIGYMAYAWTVKTANAKTRTAVSDVTVTGSSLTVSTNGTPWAVLTKDIALNETNSTEDVRYYYNGVDVDDLAGKDKTDVQNLAAERGVKVDFIDNDNSGRAEVVVVTDYTVAEVTGIANESNTGSNATKKDSYYLDNLSEKGRENVPTKNLVCDDELVMRDVVTYVEYNGDYYVTVAPLTTDTFDKITREKVDLTNKSDYIYTIGGEEYLVAEDYDVYKNNVLVKENLDESVDIYTDPYGYILTAALTEYPTNYVFVMENEQTSVKEDATETRLAFIDGTIDWLFVDKVVDGNDYEDDFFYASDSWTTDENDKGIPNHIYAYVEKNGVYTLKDAECKEATIDSYPNGKAAFGDDLGLNKSSIIVDLRAKYLGEVYTGYSEVPSLTKAEVHYLADANGIVVLAYLLKGENSADLSADFIVYNTDVNDVEKVDGERTYYLDVLVDGAVVEDYALTEARYAQIEGLGIGHYQYDAKGNLTYTSFAEDWYDVAWYDGTLVIKDGSDNTFEQYEDIPFNVIDVTANNADAVDSYEMVYGVDQANLCKAYMTYDNRGNVKEIYILCAYNNDGDAINVANRVAATNGEPTSDYTKGGTVNYWAKDGRVTGFKAIVEDEKPENTLYTLNVAGREIVKDGKLVDENTVFTGDGKSEATAFTYTVTVCSTNATISDGNRLEMAFESMGTEVTAIRPATSSTYVISGNSATDSGKTVSNQTIWTVKTSDGAYYTVDVDVVTHVTVAVDSAYSTKAKIENTTDLKVVIDVATEDDVTIENTFAKVLDVTGGTITDWDADTMKLTVTGDCGCTIVYDVTYVTSIS